MNIFVINGGLNTFNPKAGKFNNELSNISYNFFSNQGDTVRVTDLKNLYTIEQEVDNFVWADLIIYHFPIWWFSLPYPFKEYLDKVLSAGHGRIYKSDGRHTINPKMNYGKGGLLKGRYLLTSTWNAPLEAFTTEGELMNNHLPDDGVLYGFHKMNSFIGLQQLDSMHFYDVLKDTHFEESMNAYRSHLKSLFE